MKIKRFFAPDMRQAIRLVREAMGPDAVILSNERVKGGIELVAATDYDESIFESDAKPVLKPALRPASRSTPIAAYSSATASASPVHTVHVADEGCSAQSPVELSGDAAQNIWSQEPTLVEMRRELSGLRGLLVNQLSGLAWHETQRNRPLYARLLQRMMALGLSPALARHIAEAAPETEDFDHHWRQALGRLAHALPITDDDILEQGGVVALVGPTGAGKTTSVAKLAARYTLRHGAGRVALVATDSFRIGAQEQLRTYARILGVPLRAADNGEALREALVHFADKDLVLIDTAGMGPQDLRLNQQLALLNEEACPVRSYLVLAANTQRRAMEQAVTVFRHPRLTGCILTKIDEAASLGGALSVAVEQQLAVAYLTDGQQVPEDMHAARAHTLVSRCVTLMQHGAVGRKDVDTLTIGGMVAHAHG